MEFSFTLKIKAKKEDAWEYYANIEKWYDWEKDLKNITLKGEFKTGSCGTMELEGMPPQHVVSFYKASRSKRIAHPHSIVIAYREKYPNRCSIGAG